jgi:hypothetical protein
MTAIDQMKNAVKPASQAKSSPASTNLPSLVKVEQSHAIGKQKKRMENRAALTAELIELDKQHIDYCEARHEAEVQAHIESKGTADFLADTGLSLLMSEFMPAIAPTVQRALVELV